jgi:stage V sporulation protein G
MKITEVRIFKKANYDKKLRAFATITIDNCFVVRDIKIIDGSKGLFVAMPSRRLKVSCARCGNRNVIRSAYCSHCGSGLHGDVKHENLDKNNASLRQSEHKDIVHPITIECREYVQKTVLDAYTQKKDEPGSKESTA